MCAIFAAGPTIAGCKYDKAGAAIEVSLDAERLGGEGVAVQPFDTNVAGECVRESRLYFSTPVFLLLNLPFLSFPFLSFPDRKRQCNLPRQARGKRKESSTRKHVIFLSQHGPVWTPHP
jgi:hypothetical protein